RHQPGNPGGHPKPAGSAKETAVTRQHNTRSTRSLRARRAAVVAATAAAGAALIAGPAQPASAVTTTARQAPAFMTCDGIGALSITGGHVRVREHTVVDRRGRSHVFFTVDPQRVRLADDDGTHYRFAGSGYDYVVYPGRAVTGRIVREDEVFTFD